jgi:hypothetical protein
MYVLGLLSGAERKNSWTIAEQAGDLTPDGMQRLLNFYRWDANAVRDDLRRLPAGWASQVPAGSVRTSSTHSRRPANRAARAADSAPALDSRWRSSSGRGPQLVGWREKRENHEAALPYASSQIGE